MCLRFKFLTQKIKFNLLYGSKICVKLLFKKARSFKSYLSKVQLIHSNEVILIQEEQIYRINRNTNRQRYTYIVIQEK